MSIEKVHKSRTYKLIDVEGERPIPPINDYNLEKKNTMHKTSHSSLSLLCGREEEFNFQRLCYVQKEEEKKEVVDVRPSRTMGRS